MYLFSILVLFMGAAAHGQDLYTRTGELSCGNTKVQAFTTCTEDSDDVFGGGCTEQHFLFLNRTTGAKVKVNASGHLVIHRDPEGNRVGVWLDGFSGDWACVKGKAGSYVVVRHEIADTEVGYPRYEIFDVNGRKLASDRDIRYRKDTKAENINTGFERTWHSLGLPAWPWASFVSIQYFKKDRR